MKALASGRVLLMDGAMGTELQRAGISEGECYESWNLTHPDRVLAIYNAYVKAGADCLLTNTFQANPTALARHGLAGQLEAIHRAGRELARAAAAPGRFVLADVGPLPEPGDFRAMAAFLDQADGVLLETQTNPVPLLEAWATEARFPSKRVPLLVSFTFWRRPSGELATVSGLAPEDCVRLVFDFPIDALGVNCGRDVGLADIIQIVRRYREVTELPLFARPNAGTPTRVGDQWAYPETPEHMAAHLPELLASGAAMVGGCCGTTPEHIAAFRTVVDAWNAAP